MAFTPNEHIILDEQLVAFRDRSPFYMFIKSKPVKYGIKLCVAADAKEFHAYDMQVYTSKSDKAREKKQSHQVGKDMVCHMYGTRKGVTADNFFTSRKPANLLLTRNVTMVGTLRENKPEISALFLSGKQKEVYFLYLVLPMI